MEKSIEEIYEWLVLSFLAHLKAKEFVSCKYMTQEQLNTSTVSQVNEVQ